MVGPLRAIGCAGFSVPFAFALALLFAFALLLGTRVGCGNVGGGSGAAAGRGATALMASSVSTAPAGHQQRIKTNATAVRQTHRTAWHGATQDQEPQPAQEVVEVTE